MNYYGGSGAGFVEVGPWVLGGLCLGFGGSPKGRVGFAKRKGPKYLYSSTCGFYFRNCCYDFAKYPMTVPKTPLGNRASAQFGLGAWSRLQVWGSVLGPLWKASEPRTFDCNSKI